MRRIYVAGPMTGLPLSNYPAFHAEAARLRSLGYEVENPADGAKQETWNDYMRQALRMMLTCDAMVLLDGWQDSTGATIEVELAQRVGIQVFNPGWRLLPYEAQGEKQ